MANNRFIFAIIICFFPIAAIPAKTSVQTPILNKIYAITLKKIIPPSPLKTPLNHLEGQIKDITLFNTKCIKGSFKIDYKRI